MYPLSNLSLCASSNERKFLAFRLFELVISRVGEAHQDELEEGGSAAGDAGKAGGFAFSPEKIGKGAAGELVVSGGMDDDSDTERGGADGRRSDGRTGAGAARAGYAHSNTVSYNSISRFMLKMVDSAGIYVTGRQPHSRMQFNFISEQGLTGLEPQPEACNTHRCTVEQVSSKRH